jgi:hypothetical protein
MSTDQAQIPDTAVKLLRNLGQYDQSFIVRPLQVPRPIPPMVDDQPGRSLKPTPAHATSKRELLAQLRALWEWCGRPSSRRIAAASGGAFSHTTVSKLLRGRWEDTPPLTMDYVRGLVVGLGGDEAELSRWVTRWREIDQREDQIMRDPFGVSGPFGAMGDSFDVLGNDSW